MSADVELKGLTKHFGRGTDKAAVSKVSLSIEHGEFVALVGPSGCGKSTTLRMIAGLEEPDAGEIWLGGQRIDHMPAQKRNVAMVFQGYALYPTMTVFENIEFPLKMRNVPASERAKTVREAATLLRLDDKLKRLPGELSGGERQRVAIGRALVRDPRVFLFDEPLSNLDAALRAELRMELVELLRKLKRTALFVTHDQVEAMTMASRIAVMNEGQLLSFDTPKRTYEEPHTLFVGGFLGSPKMNLLEIKFSEGCATVGPFELASFKHAPTRALVAGIRPDDFRPSDDGVDTRVVSMEPLGAETIVHAETDGTRLRIRLQGFAAPRETLRLARVLERYHVFDKETGVRLE